jgi:hypothetical protein
VRKGKTTNEDENERRKDGKRHGREKTEKEQEQSRNVDEIGE